MTRLQGIYVRDLYYLKHSAEDSIDFMLNTILLVVGLFIFSYPSLFTESPNNYTFYISYNIHPNEISPLYIIVPLINFIRLFSPFRLKVAFVSFLKTLTLFCYNFIFISSIHKAPLSVFSITYLVLTIFSLRYVIKAR